MARQTWRLLILTLLAPVAALAGAATASDGPRLEEVQFTSHGATLSGSIAWPVNLQPKAAVVFIHGSGKQSRDPGLARRFAEAGIVALVYDKRGVGKSGGTYEGDRNVSEQNLLLLADDASAALDLLRGQPALKGLPVGFTGISQAGWIAPLAAQRNGKSDFLVLWSGPVCKVSEEDIFSKFTTDADAKSVPTWQQALAESGIQTGIHYPTPVHLLPAFADLGHRRGEFPHSERAADEVLSLPMFPELTVAQCQEVARAIDAIGLPEPEALRA